MDKEKSEHFLEKIEIPPAKPLIPGMFGPGTIKGGKIKRLKAKTERLFLQACCKSANVSMAAQMAGVSYVRVYEVMASNPAFKARVHQCLELGLDRLENSAYHRATVGVKEPVFYRGEKIAEVRKPSDKLACFILEHKRPEVYGQRRTLDVSGSVHVSHAVELSDEQLAKIASQSPTIIEATLEDTKQIK